MQVKLSDDEEEATNEAISWFGYAESHSTGNGTATVSLESVSVDESFDEDKVSSTHSKEFQLTTEHS